MEPKETIRPHLAVSHDPKAQSAIEQFQNKTLRPILKLQHPLLVAYFKAYLQQKKTDLNRLPAEKKKAWVEKAFKNDQSLKREVKGLILGHFTVAEFEAYRPIAQDANKRIWTMACERLLSVWYF